MKDIDGMRKPLPGGTKIEYCGQEAVVVFDNGGDTLEVKVDGMRERWDWVMDGKACVVVKGVVTQAEVELRERINFAGPALLKLVEDLVEHPTVKIGIEGCASLACLVGEAEDLVKRVKGDVG